MAITVEGVGGAAGAPGSVTDAQWAQMWQDGLTGLRQEYVATGLQVSPASGRLLNVTAGRSFQVGTTATLAPNATVTIAGNPASTSRIDTVCMQVNWAGTETTAGSLVVVQGVAAANPVARQLTKNPGGIWQTPLAYVTVTPGTGSTLGAGSIVLDARPGVNDGVFAPLLITGSTWSQDPSASLALGVMRVGSRVEMTGQITRTGSSMATGDSATFGGSVIIPDGYRPRRGLVVHGVSGLVANDIAEQRFIFQPDGTCTMWVTRGTLATGRVIRVDTTTYLGA